MTSPCNQCGQYKPKGTYHEFPYHKAKIGEGLWCSRCLRWHERREKDRKQLKPLEKTGLWDDCGNTAEGIFYTAKEGDLTKSWCRECYDGWRRKLNGCGWWEAEALTTVSSESLP